MTTRARNARARLRAAQLETDAAAERLQGDVARLRAWVRRHRIACIVAGGFLGGVALSALPRRMWARVGAIAGAGAAAIARSMLAPMIAGAFAAKAAAPAAVDKAVNQSAAIH